MWNASQTKTASIVRFRSIVAKWHTFYTCIDVKERYQRLVHNLHTHKCFKMISWCLRRDLALDHPSITAIYKLSSYTRAKPLYAPRHIFVIVIHSIAFKTKATTLSHNRKQFQDHLIFCFTYLRMRFVDRNGFLQYNRFLCRLTQ